MISGIFKKTQIFLLTSYKYPPPHLALLSILRADGNIVDKHHHRPIQKLIRDSIHLFHENHRCIGISKGLTNHSMCSYEFRNQPPKCPHPSSSSDDNNPTSSRSLNTSPPLSLSV